MKDPTAEWPLRRNVPEHIYFEARLRTTAEALQASLDDARAILARLEQEGPA